MTSAHGAAVKREDLDQLVADADMGGRKPLGTTARLMTVVAVCW